VNEDRTAQAWRKSNFSGEGDCVEWMATGDQVCIRNSGHRDGDVLVFTRSEWLAFVAGVKDGQADLA
jgi:hypothetical protein